MTVRRFQVDGIVQGVGFRPFVYRTAAELGLTGWVANANGHVEGEVAGPPHLIEEFAARLRADAPPLARVRRVRLTNGIRRSAYDGGFHVRRSAPDTAATAPREIPPDAAICEACLHELRDPRDRRHRYPFINCTDCGPRATIIEDLPYDRIRTTMRHFPLCAQCAAEYANPADRRFHAEPVACPVCGPRLAWDELRGEEALRAAVKTVDAGGIIALKGLGGYQLVCDAGDPAAVTELRRRKHRPAKPFAVMVRDPGKAARLAQIGATEHQALTSPARPVVLLARRRWHGAAPLAREVHPGLTRVALFLPTTGLHHLLLDELARPLVVTSGNLSDEPITVDDTEARRTLAHVADGYLTHDRPIRSRYDDSVVQFTGRTRITVRRARGLAPAPLPLRAREPRPWRIMEVCGGQTHTLVRQGIDELLPAGMRMIHGPGCPVCVTPLETLDRAMAIAARPGVILTNFGDMLRVPGTDTELLSLRAPGADVRVVYAPMDAVRLAADQPDREVVFLAVGFETTAPANAMAVLHAARLGLTNFSMLVSHVLVPPAMTALLDDPDCEVQAFLAAGHVCAVMGWTEYEPIAAGHRVPIVVTGFEPLDLLEGILMAVRQLESGRYEVENQYVRAVRRSGNTAAQDAVRRAFRVTDRAWRGIGPLPDSGLELPDEYREFDAARRFDVGGLCPVEDPECIAGAILTGAKLPTDCAVYGTRCTPRHPLGAPMVSSEGTCAAFHAAGRTPSRSTA